MTATYNPAELERLIAEARRIVARLEHGHGIKHVTHDSVPTMRAMSDQLEAARARIAELEGGLREACDHLSVMRSLDQRVTERLRELVSG